MDVKKLGRIPDGGGWRAHGRAMATTRPRTSRPIGYDYVHSLVDDHSRLAYSEILPDEKGTDLRRVPRARRRLLRRSRHRPHRAGDDRQRLGLPLLLCARSFADLGARQTFIRPHCPWQNGKVERLNRTLHTEWALVHPGKVFPVFP